ncbi:hypothetical protein GCM10023107_76730 [Actinoplanes octamycinicus]|nr:hypothetical protein Aoc01nite_77550 [Actinoplanes octamycinicus]
MPIGCVRWPAATTPAAQWTSLCRSGVDTAALARRAAHLIAANEAPSDAGNPVLDEVTLGRLAALGGPMGDAEAQCAGPERLLHIDGLLC